MDSIYRYNFYRIKYVDELDHLDNEGRRQLRRERLFRDRENPLENLPAHEIRKKYRFHPSTIVKICDLVAADIERDTNRNNSLTVVHQVVIALRFYATGAFHDAIGADNSLKVSKSTVCRVIAGVSDALVQRVDQFIKFPENQNDLQKTKQGFFDVIGFPGVIGAIDGSQFPIVAPHGDEEPYYVNRKGYHSINVQAVCNSERVITNLVVRWPGSTHDSRIFQNSHLWQLLENGPLTGKGHLLGDSGYGLTPFVLTPFAVVQTPAQQRYNDAHSRTRVYVENTFGVWKRRFQVHYIPLRMAPSKAVKVITATACLHNLGATCGDIWLDDHDDQDDHTIVCNEDPFEEIGHIHRTGRPGGVIVRERIVQQYFS